MPEAALRLRRITLHNFRNYRELLWQPEARLTVLTGANGAGKTNLLEAISLLGPGRGLRRARLSELAHRPIGPDSRWAVAGRFEHPREGLVEVATGTPPDGSHARRVFRLDRAPQASQAAIARRIAMVWLTPDLTRLFREGASFRRRFLDHMVLSLEGDHARELAAYEAAMQSRNRLLAAARVDPAWISGLEESMARHAVAIAWARDLLVRRLSRTLAQAPLGLPPLTLALSSPIAERLATRPALEVEEWFANELAERREEDRAAGAAGIGVHRTDLAIATTDAAPASLASSGEQQALLLALVLAHASLVAEQRGFAPLLLLDEPTTHLDSGRRSALFARLRASSAQCVLTAVEPGPLRALASLAQFVAIDRGRLVAG